MDCPLTEWILYVNAVSKRQSLRKRSLSNLLKVFLTDYYQKKDEHHFEKLFKGPSDTTVSPRRVRFSEWPSPTSIPL